MIDNSVQSSMRPIKGQSTLYLPITFDYSGGRRDSISSARIWAIVISIVGIIMGIGTIFNKNRFFITNIILGVLIIYITFLIVRFPILKEGKFRREFITVDMNKMKYSVKNIWGIYNIGKLYPYICRFRNGKSGVFIRLNKDVVLGKYSNAEYEHYEAIADAYNIAGSSKIQMCHIDYMSDIGKDERLDGSFTSLKDVDNEDVKDLLTDIFSYQKEQMQERVTTYDVYLFLWRGSDIGAWNTIQNILSCFMQANFRSYQLLNENELRDLAKDLFRLKEFSVMMAMLNAFDSDIVTSIVPIKLEKSDGSTVILGKTIKQQKEEMELEEKKAEIRRQEKKAGKTSKLTSEDSNLDWNEEIDLD